MAERKVTIKKIKPTDETLFQLAVSDAKNTLDYCKDREVVSQEYRDRLQFLMDNLERLRYNKSIR